MDKELFEDLKQSLQEMVEHSEGKRELKTTILPRPIEKLTTSEFDDYDDCHCRGEWVNEGHLKTISICRFCQQLMLDSGSSKEEIEAEVKSLGLILD